MHPDRVRVQLEDGTIVEDEDYFACIDPNTVLVNACIDPNTVLVFTGDKKKHNSQMTEFSVSHYFKSVATFFSRAAIAR